MLRDIRRRRPLPDDEALAQDRALVLADYPAEGSRDLAGPVHGQVQEHAAGCDRVAEQLGIFGHADPAENNLLGECGLAETLAAGYDQRLAIRPQHGVAFTPQGPGDRVGVEDERVAGRELVPLAGVPWD